MPRGVHTVATSCASHNIEFAAWSSQCYLRHRLRLTPLFCCWPPVPQIQVVNQASQFIQRAFDWRAEEGQQKIDEAQFRKAKCSLYLYYKCAAGSTRTLLDTCVNTEVRCLANSPLSVVNAGVSSGSIQAFLAACSAQPGHISICEHEGESSSPSSPSERARATKVIIPASFNFRAGCCRACC